MKFTTDKKTFLNSIRNLNAVIERRNTIAILGNIKIEVAGGKLNLFATDMDIEITQSIDIDGKVDGITTVCSQTLTDIVSKLKDGDISLEQKDTSVIVKSGRSRFKLPCLDHNDFPQLNDDKYDVSFDLKSNELASLIDNIKFCASTEETRYYLNGIYLHTHEDRLRGVATDGNRMALYDLQKPDGLEDFKGVIVPSKALAVMRKMIEGESVLLNVSISEHKILIKTDSSSITSKLIDGTFPDYDRVIPKSNENVLTSTVDDIRSAIDRVSTVSDARSNSVKLAISSNNLVVSAGNSDGSSATEDLEGANQFGLDIGFNSKLLLDALAHVKSDTCTIKFDQAHSPAIIEGNDGLNCVYVVMPLRV